jgi:hypothetical protein
VNILTEVCLEPHPSVLGSNNNLCCRIADLKSGGTITKNQRTARLPVEQN